MNEIEKASQNIYGEIRQSIIHVRQNIQKAVNVGMVQVYWEIGQRLDEACDGQLPNSLRTAERIELDALPYVDEGE